MTRILTLIKKELLENIRTKKVFALAVVCLFIALSSPITAKLLPTILKSIDLQGIQIVLPEPTYKDALDQFVKNVSQIGIFVIIFLVAGFIADEKTNKTLEIVLTKPLSRTQFILAKFASAFTIITLSFLVSSAVFYLYTVSIFTSFNVYNFTLISLLILLYILTISSFTLFASTVSKNAITAAGFGLVFMLLLSPIFGLIKNISSFSPLFIIGQYKQVLDVGYTTALIKPLLTSIAIILASYVLSILYFNKMEIDR